MQPKFLVPLTLLVLLASGASADYIISPVSVMQNTAGEYDPVTAPIEDTINQSGLQSTFVSGVTDFDVYFGNPLHEMEWVDGEWWGVSGVATGTIDYDLGGAHVLNRIAYWNEDSDGSVSSFKLYADTNSDFSTATYLGTFLPTDNAYGIDYPADIFSFAETTAQYIRLELVSAGNWLAMGELALAANPVPVPGAVLLGILGLGAAGRKLRRHR